VQLVPSRSGSTSRIAPWTSSVVPPVDAFFSITTDTLTDGSKVLYVSGITVLVDTLNASIKNNIGKYNQDGVYSAIEITAYNLTF